MKALREKGWHEESDIEDLKVHAGERGAVATYIANSTETTVDGKTNHFTLRASEVWVQDEDTWKLFHWHYSVLEPWEEQKQVEQQQKPAEEKEAEEKEEE
jgi:ketosteroid isomerase-like protein